RVALGGGKGRQAGVHARAQARRQRDPGGHADLLRQPLPVRVAVRRRRGAAVRHRQSHAAEAREHAGLPPGADDEAHARQQALVREQLAALEPGRQGALPGAPRERRTRRDDVRPEVRRGFRASPDRTGAAARHAVEVGAPINPGAWPRGWSSRFTLPSMPSGPAFLFDLDGTLVDSVYQHVLAWREALESFGIELSVWRIHRRIGMSGGLFINALLRETGGQFDAERAAELQRAHGECFRRHLPDVRPLPGAGALLKHLSETGIAWAIATSGAGPTARPTLDLLEIPPEVPIVTHDEVPYAKPDPHLFLAAAARLGVDAQ